MPKNTITEAIEAAIVPVRERAQANPTIQHMQLQLQALEAALDREERVQAELAEREKQAQALAAALAADAKAKKAEK